MDEYTLPADIEGFKFANDADGNLSVTFPGGGVSILEEPCQAMYWYGEGNRSGLWLRWFGNRETRIFVRYEVNYLPADWDQ